MNIETTANITIPEDFKLIINHFENKFKEKGFLNLASYLGFDWVVDKEEVLDYELAPFEAELPFPTGSNGEYMGWLNMCPEITHFRKPFICWAPSGQHIFFHGLSAKEIFQNSIRQIYSDNYKEIDLEFLHRIDIHPEEGNEIILINYGNEPLKKIPLEVPHNYRYEITIDGVGVIAKKEYFSETDLHESKELPVDRYLELSKQYINKSHFGSALFYLKEAYFRNYYVSEHQSILTEILKTKEITYKALGRFEIAKRVNNALNKRTG